MMDFMDSVIRGLIGGAGVAGIWLICIMFGLMFPKPHVDDLKRENTDLKEAVRMANERAESERSRADAAIEAARTSNLLLAALGKGVSGDPSKVA